MNDLMLFPLKQLEMLYVSSYSDYMFMNFLNVGCGHVYLVSIYSLHCMSLTIHEYAGQILLLNMFVCFQKSTTKFQHH